MAGFRKWLLEEHTATSYCPRKTTAPGHPAATDPSRHSAMITTELAWPPLIWPKNYDNARLVLEYDPATARRWMVAKDLAGATSRGF